MCHSELFGHPRRYLQLVMPPRPPKSEDSNLYLWYCICGEFILVIDIQLSNLPRRTTDGSIVIRNRDGNGQKAQMFKLNATLSSNAVFLQRREKVERQWRYHCRRCELQIGYQCCPPPAAAGTYLYILKGAVTPSQGQLPPDAFEGDNGTEQGTGST